MLLVIFITLCVAQFFIFAIYWTKQEGVIQELRVKLEQTAEESTQFHTRALRAEAKVYNYTTKLKFPAQIDCPRCGRRSHNANDIEAGYCGYCHWWTSDPDLGSIDPSAIEAQLEDIDCSSESPGKPWTPRPTERY